MNAPSKWLTPVVVLAIVLGALGACRKSTGGAGEDPYARLLAHTDRMVGILRDGEGNPEGALRELAGYEEKNGAEIEREKQALGDFMQKDPRKAAALAAAYGMKSAELSGRKADLTAKVRTR